MTEVIVALDVDTLAAEETLLKQLHGTITWYKIGLRLFTAHGKRAVELAQRHGGRVFLDLKFLDIPQTVADAVSEAGRLGVEAVSLHLSGGASMIAAAAAVKPRPQLWGVTVLTSMDEAELRGLYPKETLPPLVERLAKAGLSRGVDAVICSAQEVARLRKNLAHLSPRFVTPGIRPAGKDAHDQRRTMTPGQAAKLGIEHIVIGRPITHAPDPLRAAQAIMAEMKAAAPRSLEGPEARRAGRPRKGAWASGLEAE